jgi:hypothetical protein
MTIIKIILLMWIAGWLVCSMIYTVDSVIKSKQNETGWSLKENLYRIATMLIMWPFTVIVYIYAKRKLSQQ